ncbi:MAG: hypothetical protein MZW92_32810 [Comamonadaceae bacterium]|nr:hypothetical protein [Comamonadaceae bacterium]
MRQAAGGGWRDRDDVVPVRTGRSAGCSGCYEGRLGAPRAAAGDSDGGGAARGPARGAQGARGGAPTRARRWRRCTTT